MSLTALETYLDPFKRIFSEDGVNEVSINRPFEAWVEKKGAIRYESMPELDFDHLKSLSMLVAQYTDQKISEETPLLSATLPTGFRIQIVIPPACEPGTIAMSIRKPSDMKLTLEDYDKMGAFQETIIEESIDENAAKLLGLLKR